MLLVVLHWWHVTIAIHWLPILLGVPHVATTAFFWTDRELQPHRSAHWQRFYLAPVAVVAGAVVVALFLPPGFVALGLVGFAIWNVHHFTKQNLGMVAFVLREQRLPGLTGDERQLIKMTSLIGAFGVLRFLHPLAVNVPDASLGTLLAVATFLYCTIKLVALERGAEPLRIVAFGACVAFYAPLFLFAHDPVTATVAYGAAHGAQYFLMMLHMRNGRESTMTPLVKLIGVTVLGGILLVNITDAGTLWLLGLSRGLVIVHFIADAGIWKLSDPDQRAYMRRRFVFI